MEPELHVVGEICAGKGFASSNALCGYSVVKGKYWECVGGKETGQTQVDYPDSGLNNFVWNHPIDLHYFHKAPQGWPALCLQVWTLDSTGGKSLCGYGTCYIPSTPGAHEMKCPIWRPSGTPKEEVSAYFLGMNPQLVDKDVVFKKAAEQRYRLFTQTTGFVKLHLEILVRRATQA